MTAGEHSGRGYGRDDQEQPSHDNSVGGSDTGAGSPGQRWSPPDAGQVNGAPQSWEQVQDQGWQGRPSQPGGDHQTQSWQQPQQAWDQTQSWQQPQQAWDQTQNWQQPQQAWDQTQSWQQPQQAAHAQEDRGIVPHWQQDDTQVWHRDAVNPWQSAPGWQQPQPEQPYDNQQPATAGYEQPGSSWQQDQTTWQQGSAWQESGYRAGGSWQDQGGYYSDDRTQAFQRPAEGFGSTEWPAREPEPTGARHSAKAERADGGGGRSDRKRRSLKPWQEIPLLLVIAFCLAILVRTFLLQAFFIPSGSMEDTLLAGDRVLVNKMVYKIREPERGEVVVFRGTDAWAPQHTVDSDIGTFAKIGRALGDLIGISHPDEKDYIKRIIGLPGDRVSCCDVDGRIFVNGQPIDEDYVIHNAPLTDLGDRPHDCRARRFEEVVVEPGQMFVLGDHRAVSQDSRCQGQVPIENIKGRAFVIVWPSSRWTGLQAPEAFASVPQAGGQYGGQYEVVTVPPPPSGLVVFPLLLASMATFHRIRWVPRSPGAAEAVGSRSD